MLALKILCSVNLTPSRHHVEVGQGTPCGPVDRAGLDSLDPQVVGEHEGEDGDALIVVRPGHGARDVSRHDGDETSGEESGALRPQLLGQQIGGDGSQATGTIDFIDDRTNDLDFHKTDMNTCA